MVALIGRGVGPKSRVGSIPVVKGRITLRAWQGVPIGQRMAGDANKTLAWNDDGKVLHFGGGGSGHHQPGHLYNYLQFTDFSL